MYGCIENGCAMIAIESYIHSNKIHQIHFLKENFVFLFVFCNDSESFNEYH